MENVTNITNVTSRYCSIQLEHFGKSYREIHGYLSLLVCFLGSIANVLNISILTTKEMRWPTNYILTGLALADLMVMLEYIPYAIHRYIDPTNVKTASYFSYPAAVYMFFHALFAQVCHFISCCLTLILAIWRYIAITYVQNTNVWCSPSRTMWAIGLTYLICPIMCFPFYLSLTIVSQVRQVFENGTLFNAQRNNLTEVSQNHTLHNTTIYSLGYSEKTIYKEITIWMYGVVLKLMPCILLTIFSYQLIKALIAAKKRRYNLLSNKGIPMEKMNGKGLNTTNQRFLEKEQQTDRTTKMLLAVVLLFLIAEFPQAILGLLVGTLGNDFDKQCHIPLGDLLDIFALTNSAINFILYCVMSTQFRGAFKKLFERWRCTFRRNNNRPGEEVLTTVTQV